MTASLRETRFICPSCRRSALPHLRLDKEFFMTYFLLFLIIADQLLESLLVKQYNLKAKQNNVMLFSGVGCLFALIFFLVNSGGKLSFNISIMPYALCFAAAFGTAVSTQVFAIKTGPLSLTSLFSSYSLLIPTLYGIVFLKERTSPMLYAGLAILCVSLFLINFKKNESLKFSPVWIIFILLLFVSNGMCSTIQKMQQLKFDGAYKNEFMTAALAVVTFVLLIVGACQKGSKSEMLKPCLKYGALKGLGNGFMNYLVMVVSALLPGAVLFPSISAGGIVLTYLFSVFVYKEKLSRMQNIGYMLGVVSVILLNL